MRRIFDRAIFDHIAPALHPKQQNTWIQFPLIIDFRTIGLIFTEKFYAASVFLLTWNPKKKLGQIM